ncbi:MAG: acyl carrier protein [Streptosporangiales bacterium]
MSPSRDDDVFECVRAAVCRVLELSPDEVAPSSRLVKDLGADSLARVEIAEVMEEDAARRWGVQMHVDDVTLTASRTVGRLAKELGARLPASARGRTVPRGDRAPQQ